MEVQGKVKERKEHWSFYFFVKKVFKLDSALKQKQNWAVILPSLAWGRSQQLRVGAL